MAFGLLLTVDIDGERSGIVHRGLQQIEGTPGLDGHGLRFLVICETGDVGYIVTDIPLPGMHEERGYAVDVLHTQIRIEHTICAQTVVVGHIPEEIPGREGTGHLAAVLHVERVDDEQGIPLEGYACTIGNDLDLRDQNVVEQVDRAQYVGIYVPSVDGDRSVVTVGCQFQYASVCGIYPSMYAVHGILLACNTAQVLHGYVAILVCGRIPDRNEERTLHGHLLHTETVIGVHEQRLDGQVGTAYTRLYIPQRHGGASPLVGEIECCVSTVYGQHHPPAFDVALHVKGYIGGTAEIELIHGDRVVGVDGFHITAERDLGICLELLEGDTGIGQGGIDTAHTCLCGKHCHRLHTGICLGRGVVEGHVESDAADLEVQHAGSLDLHIYVPDAEADGEVDVAHSRDRLCQIVHVAIYAIGHAVEFVEVHEPAYGVFDEAIHGGIEIGDVFVIRECPFTLGKVLDIVEYVLEIGGFPGRDTGNVDIVSSGGDQGHYVCECRLRIEGGTHIAYLHPYAVGSGLFCGLDDDVLGYVGRYIGQRQSGGDLCSTGLGDGDVETELEALDLHVRLGVRLFQATEVEFHIGLDADGDVPALEGDPLVLAVGERHVGGHAYGYVEEILLGDVHVHVGFEDCRGVPITDRHASVSGYGDRIGSVLSGRIGYLDPSDGERYGTAHGKRGR